MFATNYTERHGKREAEKLRSQEAKKKKRREEGRKED
jgi:hypothetical protein